MSNIQIKSIFEQISEIVFNTANLEIAKKSTIEFVHSKNINDKDKQSILKSINECKTITRFQMYIANALLKYEGLGADRMAKEYKPHR
jgi:predicted nucleotidyltransferase